MPPPSNKPTLGKLSALSLLLCYSFLLMTFHSSFLFKMIESFHLAKEASEVGFYSGFVIDAYYFGRMLSSPFWGDLTDKFGRKPVLFLSIIATTIFTIYFSMSRKISHAIISMIFLGCSSGFLTILKTLISEIYNNNESLNDIVLLYSLGFSGYLIGPYLGSCLMHHFVHYPYLPGAVLVSIFGLISLLLSCIFLDEPHNLKPKQKSDANQSRTLPQLTYDEFLKEIATQNGHAVVKLPHPHLSFEVAQKNRCQEENTFNAGKIDELHVFGEDETFSLLLDLNTTSLHETSDKKPDQITKTTAYHKKSRCQGLAGSMADSSSEGSKPYPSSHLPIIEEESPLIEQSNQAFYVIAGLSNVFVNTMISDSLPIWLASAHHKGGLGLGPRSIGHLFLFLAVPVVLSQIFFYPLLARSKGEYWILTRSFLLMLVATMALPYANLILSIEKDEVYLHLDIILFVRYIGIFLHTQVLQRFSNENLPKEGKGQALGLNIAMESTVQVIATILGNILLSLTMNSKHEYPLNYHLLFLLGSGIFLLTAIAICRLKPVQENSKRQV